MKKLLLFLLVIPFGMVAQVQLEPNKTVKTQNHSKDHSGKYFSEYVVKPEKLKTFFHTNTIPDSFPKYDKYISFEENKSIAIQWAKNNKTLIREEFWYKFENK